MFGIRRAIGAAFVLAGAGLCAAQTDSADSGLQERTRVDYVLLDVLAFDRKGQVVTDLTSDDFVVLENRKPVRIESLEVLDLRGSTADGPRATEGRGVAAASSTAATGEAPLSRQIVVTDMRWVRAGQVRKTFEELERFLEQAPADGSVVYQWFSMDAGLLLDDYSDDPSRVVAALRRHRNSLPGPGSGDLLAGDDVDDLTAFEQRLDSCRMRGDMQDATAKSRGTQVHNAEFFECIHGELQAYVLELEARTERAIVELEALPFRFGNQGVPVSFLLVSPGFSLKPGQAAIELAGVYLDRSRPVDDPWAKEDPPQLDGMTPLRSARSFAVPFRRVIDACLRNRATFHTFDMYNFNLGGERKSDARLIHGSARAAGVHKTFRAELNEGLIELAEQSGGFFHSGATLRPMRSVVDRSRFVYTLGYSSPSGKPEKFRKIKVKCKRRGVDVRYRSGYFAGAGVPVRGL